MRLLESEFFNPSGLIVAGIGFFLTRIFVSQTVTTTHLSLQYALVEFTPFLAGLALTVYGVILAIGPFSPTYVRTIAKWCTATTASMTGIILITLGVGPTQLTPLTADYLLISSNVLLGSAIGGVIIGRSVAQNAAFRREIRRQANRGLLVNRILRDKVINSASVLNGQLSVLNSLLHSTDPADVERGEEMLDMAEAEIDDILTSINNVGELAVDSGTQLTVNLHERLQAVTSEWDQQIDDITVTLDETSIPDNPTIKADNRFDTLLEEVFRHLTTRGDISQITASITQTNSSLELCISYDGAPITGSEKTLLEDREFPGFDDPSIDFSLPITRILTTHYEGDITLNSNPGDEPAQIHITFQKQSAPSHQSSGSALSVSLPDIVRVVGAGLIAGVSMGVYFRQTTNTLPIIGALYGVPDPVIGWITHLFHSIMFALMYASFVDHRMFRDRFRSVTRKLLGGIGWGIILWVFAAGFIMPFWLRVSGVSVTLPSLSPVGLSSHLLWGSVLGVTYFMFQYVPNSVVERTWAHLSQL